VESLLGSRAGKATGGIREVVMNRRVIICILLVLFVLFAAVELVAQDKFQITVKSSEVNNGVVIVRAQEGKKGVELQCNKDTWGCKIPESGGYLMVRLPKNHGIYDCQNVDIYPQSADSDNSQKIGEYCLIEQK
jgi:hypothetical protein